MTLTSVDMDNVTVTTSLWDNYTDHEYLHPACGVFDFVMEVVLMGLLCAFGFVGNTLSTVCLLRDGSKSATPFLLVSLQIADTLFLIAVVWVRVITSVEESFREQAADTLFLIAVVWVRVITSVEESFREQAADTLFLIAVVWVRVITSVEESFREQAADTLFLIAVVWVRVITSVEESFREQAAFIASLTPYIGRYVFLCAMIAETGWLLFIYLFTYLFPEFIVKQYNQQQIAENTIQYMHTWILKDECVATHIAPSIYTVRVNGWIP